MTTACPYPPSHPAFWRAYWVTLRPYLFFVSGSSGLVGLALGERIAPALLFVVFLAFSACYGLGQALTDVFQTDTDALSSPYRPLVRGEIAKRDVLAVSLAGLAACTALFAALSPFTLVPGGAAVLGLLAYTSAKRRFWAGPLWNDWIVGLLPAMGLLCSSPSASAALATPGLAWAVAATVLGLAWVQAGAWRSAEPRPLPPLRRPRLGVLVGAMFVVLIFFQLVLRRGIAF